MHYSNMDVFFLYHNCNNSIPKKIKRFNLFVFTNSILHELGYKALEGNLTPGNNHFPFLKFYLNNKYYDYYWLVEDDVYFSGEWFHFFNTFNNDESDYITTNIHMFAEESNWYWWHSLKSPILLGNNNKVRSFNPLYRLSNRALDCLDKALKNGWQGHHEVVIPTLLYNEGYRLTDMGGTGSFVPESYKNKFYSSETWNFLPIDLGEKTNYLYHPIKEKKKIDLDKLKKCCVISAVGHKSQHRTWIEGSPDFDLHIIIYDNSYNKFYNDTNYIFFKTRDTKLGLILNYLQLHVEYLEFYDYFFFPDEDIKMDSETIMKLFRLMKKNQLQTAQPSIGNLPKEKSDFACWNAPCFSREAVKSLLLMYKNME